MRRIALAVCLAACGGSATVAPPSEPSAGGRDEPALGLPELERDLEATVLENYIQLTLDNVEAWADGLSGDREVILFGVAPQASLVGGRELAGGRGRRLYENRQPRLLSKNLEVHLSTDGSIGWVYDELSYRVSYLGREASIPLRVTSVYERGLGRWLLASQHVSYAMRLRESAELAARGEMRAPAGFASGGHEEIAAELLPLVERLHGGSGDERALAVADGALLVMPGPFELRGADILAAPPLSQIVRAPVAIEIGDSHVELARSGRVAWLATTMTARIEGGGELGLRGTYVFERGDGVGWRLVQGHVSTPLLERQLSLRVFGPPDDR